MGFPDRYQKFSLTTHTPSIDLSGTRRIPRQDGPQYLQPEHLRNAAYASIVTAFLAFHASIQNEPCYGKLQEILKTPFTYPVDCRSQHLPGAQSSATRYPSYYRNYTSLLLVNFQLCIPTCISEAEGNYESRRRSDGGPPFSDDLLRAKQARTHFHL
ncbi:hypothetical protein BJY01DRAFT_118296 [Aspergillus pseudoustus]|uniref:Uncharacterized protein n=1 Tax=Aspergillus pseudoustus TaxID=1810923 RepID=A0ABR4IS99_9EURO